MSESYQWIAKTEFDCIDAKGKRFRAVARIGMPYLVPKEGKLSSYGRCAISVEPIFGPHPGGGADVFQALCLAIDVIRKVLRSFVAQGGRVFYPGTRAPIDIEDPSFCSMVDWFELQKKQKRNRKKRPSRRARQAG